MVVTATIDVSGEFDFNLDYINLKDLKSRKKIEKAKKYIEYEIKESFEGFFDEINVKKIKIDFGLDDETK